MNSVWVLLNDISFADLHHGSSGHRFSRTTETSETSPVWDTWPGWNSEFCCPVCSVRFDGNMPKEGGFLFECEWIVCLETYVRWRDWVPRNLREWKAQKRRINGSTTRSHWSKGKVNGFFTFTICSFFSSFYCLSSSYFVIDVWLALGIWLIVQGILHIWSLQDLYST